jgi:YVTN family beta-propeller protein
MDGRALGAPICRPLIGASLDTAACAIVGEMRRLSRLSLTVSAAVALSTGLALGAEMPAQAATATSTQVPVGTGPIAVAISPDGSTAYVANEYSANVTVVDLATHSVVATLPDRQTPYAIAVSPDGKWVYVADYGTKTISLIDATTNTAVGPQTVFSSSPNGVAFSSDGKYLLVTTIGAPGDTGTLTRLEIDPHTGASGAPQTMWSATGSQPLTGPSAVAMGGHGGAFTNMNLNGGSVGCLSADGTVTGMLTVGGMPQGVAVNPAGTVAAVVQLSTRVVTLVDLATCTAVSSADVGMSPVTASFSPDGARVFVSNAGASSISVIDAADGTVLATPSVDSAGPMGSAVTPDGTMLAVAGQSNNVLGLYMLPTASAPASMSVQAGTTAAFSTTVSGSPDSIAWQRSTDGGATWNDVAGATSPTYSFVVRSSDNGMLVRAVARSALWGDAVSGAGTLTVTAPAASGTTPAGASTPTGAAELAESGSDAAWPLTAAAVLLALGLGCLAMVRRSRRVRQCSRS